MSRDAPGCRSRDPTSTKVDPILPGPISPQRRRVAARGYVGRVVYAGEIWDAAIRS